MNEVDKILKDAAKIMDEIYPTPTDTFKRL